jgi:dihydrofolate synthase/folylpolyglutamate synthase
MADFAQSSPNPLMMIVGMKDTKDAKGFFEPFNGLAAHVETIAIPDDPACLSPATLAEAAREAGLDAVPASSVEQALERILAHAGHRPPRILICGSLYLAGAILAENG